MTRLFKASAFAAVLALGLLGSMGQVRVQRGWQTAPSFLCIGGCTSSFPALKMNGTIIEARVGDDSGYGTYRANNFQVQAQLTMGGANRLLMSGTAPTLQAGTFGTTPSVVANNGTAVFTVNVGTGGVATSGQVNFPTATTGWACDVTDQTTNVATRQTANTTSSVTVTAAAAWTASDILLFKCQAF